MTSAQKQNRKLWIIFIIALLIALLPWIVLAQDVTIEKEKCCLNTGEDHMGYLKSSGTCSTTVLTSAIALIKHRQV